MNEKTKSLIRHILTTVGTVLALIGVNGFIPIIDFVTDNLDGMWEAISTVVGFVLALVGFFNDKGERFEVRTASAK
tara:strand:+ start:100 stop:327 length:228 start_codon:yes stop_codon:yes gene_type:complete